MKKLVLAMAAASLLSASAWAERFALTGTPGAAYYAVTLNEDVYAHAHEASLADLRVLNGDGEPVPFSLDIPRDAPPQARALYDVHWFAAPVDDAQKPGTAGVVLGADGVLRATGTAAPQETTRAWLVDLSQLHDRKTATVTALVVALPAVEFQSGVNVQASDDLQHWSPVAQATLFRLSNQGSTLVQDRVEFTGLRAKYLRLTWQGKPPAPGAVRAEVAMGAPVAAADSAIQWRAGLAPVQTPYAGDYQFDTGGVFPVERVKVRLPQANTVAQATLYARADAQAPWRLITSARLYRLAGAGAGGTGERAHQRAGNDGSLLAPAGGHAQRRSRRRGTAAVSRLASGYGHVCCARQRAVLAGHRRGGARQPRRTHRSAGWRIARHCACAAWHDDGFAGRCTHGRAARRTDTAMDPVGCTGGGCGRAGGDGMEALPDACNAARRIAVTASPRASASGIAETTTAPPICMGRRFLLGASPAQWTNAGCTNSAMVMP